MQILGRPFDSIDLAFVEELVRDEITESHTHDYKERLPDKRDDAARGHFLSVVVAFANASGGVIVAGVDGESQTWSIPGLAAFDPDRTVLGLDQFIRAGIEPPIPGVRFRSLVRDGGDPVLLIGIPRSLSGPHRTTEKYGARFTRRANLGADHMTIGELREAFEGSARWREAGMLFHRTRAQAITDGWGGTRIGPAGALLLHLLPLGRVDEIAAGRVLTDKPFVSPTRFTNDEWDVRPFLEGNRWIYRATRDDARMWYLDLRNGGEEFFTGLEYARGGGRPGPEFYVADVLEELIATSVACMFDRVSRRGTDYPLAACATLRVTTGTQLMHRTFTPLPARNPVSMESFDDRTFDRSELQLPPLMLTSAPSDVPTLLRSWFDVMWQSAGQWESRYFDADGSWVIRPAYEQTLKHGAQRESTYGAAVQ